MIHNSRRLPARTQLFRRLLFNFLIGNEDMHLKNYSLITRGMKTELAPAYDYLNTTAVFRFMGRNADDIEESALPLNGRKRRLSRADWIDCLARERLRLTDAVVNRVMTEFRDAVQSWRSTICAGFLSPEHRKLYIELLESRLDIIFQC